MHLKEGEIRAYQDQELEPGARQRIEAHLAACFHCQARAADLSARARRVDTHLSGLAAPRLAQLSLRSARARLEARLRIVEKENQTMWNKITSRIPRPVWVGFLIIALLAGALAFPQVRAVANSFLGLFRVQQIQVVQFDPEKLPNQMGSSSKLENMLSQNVNFEGQAEPQEVASVAEANQQAGMTVRLPTDIEGAQKLFVQSGGKATLNLDLEMVKGVLSDMGRTDIQLPNELNGATIELVIPAGVTAQFGDCPTPKESETQPAPDPDMPKSYIPPKCTTLLQMPSPTISAPAGLDLAQIGEAYLQLLGMSREEAASFAKNVDWTTTFIVPIPRNGTDYQDVQVDGVTGTFIQMRNGFKEYALLWVKDGIVYALGGPGNLDTALKIAASLK